MFVDNKEQIKRTAQYVDVPNSFVEDFGETIGIIVLVLFIGAILYLFITGIPTIEIVFMLLQKGILQFFNVHS